MSPGALIVLASFALVCAAVLYVFAWVSYGVWYKPDMACMADGPDAGALPAVSHRDFPISLVCINDEGVPAERVPPWLNPMLFVLLGSAPAFYVAALVMQARSQLRRDLPPIR